MKRWYWAVGVIVLVAGGAIGAWAWASRPIIPATIYSELTSSLLMPGDKRFVVSRQSVKYNKSLKLLTFDATVFGRVVVVSEQPTPETFTDIPAVYQKVLDGMSDYNDFDVGIGTVHLTTPPQLQGKQAAVLNAAGTLLFAKPAVSLSEAQWRQFFDSFAVKS